MISFQISETYAFLPREAVTKFLSICPECFKNLRQSSPSLESLPNSISTHSDNVVNIPPKPQEPINVESLENIENLLFYRNLWKQLTSLQDSNVNRNRNNDQIMKFQADNDLSSLCRSPKAKELDLSKVKPITSTYLQLTRSMGLSDTDALQFNEFVSSDFKYTL